MKRKILAVAVAVTLMVSQVVVFADTEITKRADAPEQYKWDLTEIYESREAFDAVVNKVLDVYLPQYEALVGKLNTTENLVKYFELDEMTSRDLFTAYVFASLNADLDQTDTNSSEMVSLVGGAYGEYLSAVSFAEPEILDIPEADLLEMLKDEKLAPYKTYLEGLLASQEYVLSKEEEKIMSLAAEVTGQAKDIFDKVTLADYIKPVITDSNGEEVVLSSGAFGQILDSGTREERKTAAEAKIQSQVALNNTLTATYIAEIKKNIFNSKARGYESSLDAALYSEDISRSIYESLVKSVNENLEPLHRYYATRKAAMGLDELHYYDAYVPLVEDFEMEIPFDEAVKIIIKGLEPLGQQYISDFKMGIENNWVDAFEDDNKYTGGYQWGTYDTHPYILMNYDNSLDSLLTLAHEMGHALNSYYSNNEQNYFEANYPTFTAEVASTTNELLVMDYLIKNASSEQEKLYLLNKQIDNIRGTVYVQVMFSEFEKRTHELAEAGEALSPEVFNNLWLELMQNYYGDAYTIIDGQEVGWSFIPHFYMNFYVYKYATSMSASYAIVNKIENEGQAAIDDYLTFLASGGVDAPIPTLEKAGVDMTSTEPVESILNYFGSLVDEFADLVAKQPVKVEETSTVTTYIVQSGDVLWKIAKKHDMTVAQIIGLNQLKNPNLLEVGQTLVINK
jgi:oligoendopeptidase F